MFEIVLPVALAIIMGSVGLSLTVEDFKRVLVVPKGVLIGLANLLLLSPLLAFGIAELFNLDPIFAVGLVLMGAAPGGAMATLLTHLAKGETSLSVTMTGISSIVAVVTVPLYLSLADNHFGAGVGDDLSMIGVVARIFAITIVPVSLGMVYRARRPEAAIALEPQLKKFALGAFVLVVAGAVIVEWDRMTSSLGEVAPAALTLNLAAMGGAFLVGRLARLPDRQSTAISLELGVHNSTLVIAVVESIDTQLGIPAAVYSAFMFLTAAPFTAYMARRNAPAALAASPAVAPAQ